MIEKYGKRLNLFNRLKGLFVKKNGYIMMVERFSMEGLDVHEEEV